MGLVGLLLILSVMADIEQKQRKLEEKIDYEFHIKDTYREHYFNRFMKVD
ncbi:MAG: hypothetical protein IJ429_02105 [Lachnospiraceae bacterium]|nr:hypothetical protein [Lachnospiraceae bacterium]